MQIQSLRIPSLRIDDTTPKDALERLRKMQTYMELRSEGCSRETAFRVAGISRTSYYRWRALYEARGIKGLAAKSRRPRRTRKSRWTREQEWAVWRMRRKHLFMGKKRLRVLLGRKGIALSESTIGRILKKGLKLNRIQPCSVCHGKRKANKPRCFDGHAERWNRSMKATRPGERVQIDHMTVSRDGDTIKEFRAVCPVSKQMVTRVYSCATANNARRFLNAVLEDLPHPLLSIQVDGGSEFRAEFEDACRERKLPLAVLPPKSPQLNGVVERANLSARAEFWGVYQGDLTVKAASEPLMKYQHFYNHERPHYALDMRTPMEYLAKHEAAEPTKSQM